MPGPNPKDPSLRARRNKTATRATLKPQDNPDIPELPKGTRWYPQVRDWWQRTWSSPMVPEWTESDTDGLYICAKLMQQFWNPKTPPSVCKQLAAEIRQILGQCGLTPMSRRALQWEIDRGEAAAQSTAQRRQSTPSSGPAKPAKKRADPREARQHLAAVK